MPPLPHLLCRTDGDVGAPPAPAWRSVKHSVADESVKVKLPPADLAKVTDEVEAALTWMQTNQVCCSGGVHPPTHLHTPHTHRTNQPHPTLQILQLPIQSQTNTHAPPHPNTTLSAHGGDEV